VSLCAVSENFVTTPTAGSIHFLGQVRSSPGPCSMFFLHCSWPLFFLVIALPFPVKIWPFPRLYGSTFYSPLFFFFFPRCRSVFRIQGLSALLRHCTRFRGSLDFYTVSTLRPPPRDVSLLSSLVVFVVWVVSKSTPLSLPMAGPLKVFCLTPFLLPDLWCRRACVRLSFFCSPAELGSSFPPCLKPSAHPSAFLVFFFF